MTWQDWASLIGAVGGTIGSIAGFVVYLQSGTRVKVRISVGIAGSDLAVGLGQIGLIILDPRKFKGSLGHGIDFAHARLVVIVEAVNSGRLPVTVESLRLIRQKIEFGGANLFQGARSLPHRFDFGTTAIWTAPLDDARALAALPLPKGRAPNVVGASLKLGNGKSVKTTRHLSLKHLEEVLDAWAKAKLDTNK
ncbi:MAG: hypothetical protein RL036_487 [Actinomycetota bacterium]|jgi:hypothetical protein